MNPMNHWTVYDRYGNRIYMTPERWQHILQRRPWLADYQEDILNTLRQGRRKQDSLDPRSRDSMGCLYLSQEVNAMNEHNKEHHEYDHCSDVLDVYFGEKRAAWTIELTDHILLSLDRDTKRAVALSFLDFTELIRPTPWGPRSFPLTGLADLPHTERELVMQALTTQPVNTWLDVSVVQTMPDSPFIVMHLEPSISQTVHVLPIAA